MLGPLFFGRRRVVATGLLGLMAMAIKPSTVLGDMTPQSCTAGTDGATSDAPCKLNLYLGDMFNYDCGASPKSNPDITSSSTFKLCKSKIKDISVPCEKADHQDLSSFVALAKTANVYTATVGSNRIAQHKETYTLYAACGAGGTVMFVELSLHPYSRVPSTYTNTCDISTEPTDATCYAAVFKGEELSFTAPKALSHMVPAGFNVNSGRICPVPIGTTTCPTAEPWATFLEKAQLPFPSIPSTKAGLKFTPDMPFSDLSKIGYLQLQTTGKKYNGAITFYKGERPAELPADVKECNHGPCKVEMSLGDKVLINCTGSTSTVPATFAQKGTFCTEDLTTAATCPSGKEKIPTDVGGAVVLDSAYEKYVIVEYKVAQEADTNLYAKCVGGDFEYVAHLKFKKKGGGSGGSDSSASSAAISTTLLLSSFVVAYLAAY